jgi:hypothetical protein
MISPRTTGLLAGAIALLWTLAPDAAAAEEAARVRFNRDVRPILSDTCFKCHGPDKSKIAGS